VHPTLDTPVSGCTDGKRTAQRNINETYRDGVSIGGQQHIDGSTGTVEVVTAWAISLHPGPARKIDRVRVADILSVRPAQTRTWGATSQGNSSIDLKDPAMTYLSGEARNVTNLFSCSPASQRNSFDRVRAQLFREAPRSRLGMKRAGRSIGSAARLDQQLIHVVPIADREHGRI
jgi:hypothetical protein